MIDSLKLKRAAPTLRPVMIVDDIREDAESLRAQLVAAGIANPALIFEDGDDGISALRLAAADDGSLSRPLPCALFVNLKMGCYGGFDLLAWAAEQEFLASVPKFMLVPCVLPEDEALGVKFDAELVAKFPSNDQLAALLRSALHDRKS